MDNDLGLIKRIKHIIKNIKFKIDYKNQEILDEYDGNILIGELIKREGGLMIARGGATEMRCIAEYIRPSFKGKFSNKVKKEIRELSGVFPSTDENLQRFCEEYIKCMSKADILALWGVGAESNIVKANCKYSRFIRLRSLEPYYYNEPWSQHLEGKKVLIIHPFIDSITSQYDKREYLFDNKKVLPKFKKMECIKAVQSIAGTKCEFESWFDALEYMKAEIENKDFDIAIIGAGAYGLPLASYIKSLGKKSIQLSGATQILFGIKGNRWDNHEFISLLYNDYWKRPNDIERPQNSNKVEGGSYW